MTHSLASPSFAFRLTEGDVGWIPISCGAPSTSRERHHGWTGHEFPEGISGPAMYSASNILCCFISDPVGVENLSHFNVDNVCWRVGLSPFRRLWPNAPRS